MTKLVNSYQLFLSGVKLCRKEYLDRFYYITDDIVKMITEFHSRFDIRIPKLCLSYFLKSTTKSKCQGPPQNVPENLILFLITTSAF